MKKKTTRSKTGRKRSIILGIVTLLIIFRLFLPYILLRYTNNTLAHLQGYYGHIDDIDVSLYRGAYEINDMYLNKVDGKSKKQTDFFKAKNIDLSIEWGALLHGALVGEIELNTGTLIFTKNKTEIDDVKKDTNDFRKVLKDFMPIKVNRFEVNNGSIHYKDQSSTPNVDIALQNTHILAQNLKNVTDSKSELPSSVTAEADAYGGKMVMNMKMDALAKRLKFDLNAEVKNTNLVKLNDFLKAYGGFDVHRGTIGLYTEFAAKNGKYKGYVKPIVKDLDVVGPEDKKDNILNRLWENVIGGAAKVFKNPKKDQLATKIPMEGNLEGSDTDISTVVWQLLRNAFIHALMPSVDNIININSVDEKAVEKKGLYHRIFGRGKDKKDKKKKK